MENKPRVLFIPRWYPSRYDPMPGLFVLRQAEALVPYCDIAVIYLHFDDNCPENKEVEFKEENGVRVIRIYHRPRTSMGSVFSSLLNIWYYYRYAMKAYKSIQAFKPDLIHAHVLTRAAFIGWKISRKTRKPLIISEHWSRYFDENMTYTGFARKLLTWYIVKKSDALIPVSAALKTALIRCGLNHKNMPVIPNVVDHGIFNFAESQHDEKKIRFVHISCFDDKSKNISGFLRSLKKVTEQRDGFCCLMVGDGPDFQKMKNYASGIGIQEEAITFTGLMEGTALAGLLRNADFSVLSSRYETFGTVIIESLFCGTPVLTTRVGIAAEVITRDNGMIIEPGREDLMTEALGEMMMICRNFNRRSISSQIAGKFENQAVGKKIAGVYHQLITSGR